MSPSWYSRLADGLSRSRERLAGQLNVLLGKGPDLDDEFWSDLEDTLLASDIGVTGTTEIVARLKDRSKRENLPDSAAVIEALVESIAAEFPDPDEDPFDVRPVTLLFVGVNGAGKTTTVGKVAKQGAEAGRKVVLGSADTFRAAASEQLDIWAERAGVPVVRRDRGADPAAVAFETIESAEKSGADLTLIDTAGRLHTSADLMRELTKIKRVAENRSKAAVRTILVMDSTTGQNGLAQAREFGAALAIDGIVLTKLDGTAKGGIAVAIARELGIPVLRIGVGEGIDDLRPFDAAEFSAALVKG
ncbi:MAG: signal recognition particle-docking protein FtsY [Coriobacteriia bacterium]|nr:signal recognition particle-docking protein FtsY [Coriobacteriia bacterium]